MLVGGHLRAGLLIRTQKIPIGTEFSQQILRLRQDFCFLRFTGEQDDDVVATWTHAQDKWILTKGLPAYIRVFNVRGIKHIVRHVHGKRIHDFRIPEGAHDWSKHIGDSRSRGIRVSSSPKSLRNFSVNLIRLHALGPQFGSVQIILQKCFRAFGVVTNRPKDIIPKRPYRILPIAPHDDAGHPVCSFLVQNVSFGRVQ